MASRLSRLLLVTHHSLFGECLSNALTTRIAGLTVERANNLEQASERCDRSAYALTIFDVDALSSFTPAITRRFAKRFVKTLVLILGRTRAEGDVLDHLEAGAVDFLFTSDPLDDFCGAIERLLRGEIAHRPNRTRALFARLQELSAEVSRIKSIDTRVLTDREMEILRLVDEGQSNKQIGKAMHISLHTVKNHVHRILEKLRVTNRREAVHLAHANGWLKVEMRA